MEKSPDAFRTISEVAAELDLPQHVLRFWETRFTQIKPLKRGGGRRYYRPDDVDLLSGIRKLLYGEGFTIKGVQRLLKENGVHWVMDVGRGLESGAPAGTARDNGPPDHEPDAPRERAQPSLSSGPTAGGAPPHPETASGRPSPGSLPSDQAPHRQAHPDPATPLPAVEPPARRSIVPTDERPPRDVLIDEPEAEPRAPRLFDRLRGEPRGEGAGQPLVRDDVRRLQSTLFELLECKRILDQAR